MSISPTNTLWVQALQSLSVKDQETFGLRQPDDFDIGGLLNDVEAKKKECIAKRWKFKKNGREVVIRDQLEKIIVWVNQFKTVGDVAVQYDPAHAALPWAGVRFLLQIAVNDSQIFGGMIEGVEHIAHIITKYAFTERLYLQMHDQTACKNELSQSLMKLYAAVLVYLSKAKRYYTQNTAGNIHLGENTKALQEALAQLESPICRSAAQLSDLHDSLKKEERLKIFRWLSTVPHKSHHENMGNDFLPDSGQWLFQMQEFIDWRASSVSSILLLHGIPGSGKSKIIYSTIEYFRQRASGMSSPAPMAYFYCVRNEAEPFRADPTEILRSILKQLCSSKANHPVRLPVVKEFQKKKEIAEDDGSEPLQLKNTECIKLILEILENEPATIVIDALDECDPKRRHELLEALDEIIQRSANLVQVFVSSRDDGDILARLASSPNIYISVDHNKADIKRFIDRQVTLSIEKKKLNRGHVSQELKDLIISKLEAGANGMFRWVDLQIQNLCDPDRIKHENDIRRELGHLPESLKSLYGLIYERLLSSASTSRLIAENAMKYLLGAKRPLRSQELISAISRDAEGQFIVVSSEELLDMCCNFIVLDVGLDMFRFAHLSVQEYLEESRPEYNVLEINSILTDICIDVLVAQSLAEEVETDPPDARFLFSSYAIIYWPFHYHHVETEAPNRNIKQKMRSFFFRNGDIAQPFIDWTQNLYALEEVEGTDWSAFDLLYKLRSAKPTPFFLACRFAWTAVLRELIASKDFDCDQKTMRGLPGICVAAKIGHVATVRLLIQVGVDVDSPGLDHRTPLHLAAEHGYEELVKLLLQSGAKVNQGAFFTETALHVAATEGGEAIVGLLVQHNADVNAETGQALGLLADAASKERARRVLPDAAGPGKKIEMRTVQRLEVLHAEGTMAVSHMSPWSNSHTGTLAGKETALHRAAKRGHEGVVRFLMGQGANAMARDSFGNTPLQSAVIAGQENIVRLFAEENVNLDGKNETGTTALDHAFLHGHKAISKLLIENGADLRTDDDDEMPILHLAAAEGHAATVMLLIQKGVELETKNFLGETALHAAVGQADEDTVMRLLENGANIEAEGANGKKAIHYAVEAGYHGMIKFLVEHGANVNAKDDYGQTALHKAICQKIINIVCLLIESGADLNAKDNSGMTALHTAAEFGSGVMMMSALDLFRHYRGEDYHYLENSFEGTSRGVYLEKVMKLLMENGADLGAQNEKGSTVLDIAIAGKQDFMIRLLQGFYV